MTVSTTCPRCGADLANEPGGGALSRVDNATYICSPCGTAEALYNLVSPMRDLPPLDEPIAGTVQSLTRSLHAVSDNLTQKRAVWDSVRLSDLRTGEYHTVRLVTSEVGVTYLEVEGSPLPVVWVDEQ